MVDTTSVDQNKRAAEIVLGLVRELAKEVRPSRDDFSHISLDSSLEKDLGFDSLTRVELLARLGRTFSVDLPESALVSCETPRDFLRHVFGLDDSARKSEGLNKVHRQVSLKDESFVEVIGAKTLSEVLEFHFNRHPARTHIIFLDENEERRELTYEELWHGSISVAAGLREMGVMPGQSVAIMLPTCLEYFCCFMGTILCGGVPVPLYPPMRASQVEEHMERHANILRNCLADVLVTYDEAISLAKLLRAGVDSLRHVVSAGELFVSAKGFEPRSAAEGDTAFLQYTSGSTGSPKGVILSHANLLANIRAMGKTVNAGPKDVFVSWLPLYHDMGLIGAWLGSLYFGSRLVLMSPLSFLLKPERWLWAIHRYGGTLSAAPNFGYELCLKRIDEHDIKGLDLSTWRKAFNGAEPVSHETLEQFTRTFSPYGLQAEALTPVYGLAESSVGLVFPPKKRIAPVDMIDRDIFMRTGKAVRSSPDDRNGLCFVGSGKVLAGHYLRIVDISGNDVGEEREGRLLFQGPSSTTGYFRNSEATTTLFQGDWLDSGDLAYIRDGEVYITGRVKDIIIKNGRNIYPQELEEAVGMLEGVRKGCCAVFGSGGGGGSEELVIVAETRESDEVKMEELRHSVNQCTIDILGMAADEIVLAPPGTVLKTSSGKVRRSAMKKLHEDGGGMRKNRAVWWQMTRFVLFGSGPQLRRMFRELSQFFYGGYCWLLLALFSVVGLPAGFLFRGGLRLRILKSLARLLVKLSGTPLRVQGLENIPLDRPVIFVANHMSYLDGFALFAVLPRRVSFVAKSELQRNFLVRIMLNALEVEFVERFDVEEGLSDMQRLTIVAGNGRSLLFFAEGTLHCLPGLLPFHMGAFMAATETDMDVVPLVIKGTRKKMCSGRWFPLPGAVSVVIEKPIRSEGSGWQAALALRNNVRLRILYHVGEPDLGNVRAPVPNSLSRGKGNEAEEG